MTAAALARFGGRTALLTAAASGIGEATAHRLALEGASVVVTDVDAEAAHRVAEDIRASIRSPSPGPTCTGAGLMRLEGVGAGADDGRAEGEPLSTS
ncbi:SDR family NAD(P)-dependent oxidoreductase [Streptomyces sp. NPDC001848]|uniref:SDR family NAD(P)-dependent oxidoreductase n=1 Tax=Streptomyces sp. NPDC001848 TaxID=3364618 RepID=UPI00368AE0E8